MCRGGATPRKEDAVRGSTAHAMAWIYLTVPLAVIAIMVAIVPIVVAIVLESRAKGRRQSVRGRVEPAPNPVLAIRDRATVCAICSCVIADELTHRMATHSVTGAVARDMPVSVGTAQHQNVQSQGRTPVLTDRNQKVGWQ